MASFDVIFIGGGPAGYVGAIRCAQLGLSTAVVERDGEWFIAYCTEVPGANGQGHSREESLDSLRDAIALDLDAPPPLLLPESSSVCHSAWASSPVRFNRTWSSSTDR